MKQRTYDKIHLLAWNIDKYIKQSKKHDKVNGIAISQMDIDTALMNKTLIKKLLDRIMAKGLYQFQITSIKMKQLNRLYKRYKIDLNIYPQYQTPKIRANG